MFIGSGLLVKQNKTFEDVILGLQRYRENNFKAKQLLFFIKKVFLFID